MLPFSSPSIVQKSRVTCIHFRILLCLRARVLPFFYLKVHTLVGSEVTLKRNCLLRVTFYGIFLSPDGVYLECSA